MIPRRTPSTRFVV